jgi:sulfide:quinone oxidoreductase
MKRILVLGGGFAGVESAIYLRKENFKVDLVSNRDYMYIYPTSIWVPVHDAQFEDVQISLKQLSIVHGFNFIEDEVQSINAKEGVVSCKNSVLKDYDYIVIAIGAGKMKHAGNEHFLSICGAPEESLALRDKLDSVVRRGHGKIVMGFGGNPKDTTGVRGGPAFEMMFNVHNYLKKRKIRKNYELTFFAPMKEPGARLGKDALKMMDMFFERLNINKHFGKKIKAFEEDGVVFEDDSKLQSDLTMFIPANDGLALFRDSDLPLNEAGFIKINNFCQVQGFENIYAIGDSAEILGPEWRAKQGHIAEVMARNTANNIAVHSEMKMAPLEGYKEHLNILCVMDSGDGAAFVYRDDKGGRMIPMPIVGHWMKKAWGVYCKKSKLNKIPRIPGM